VHDAVRRAVELTTGPVGVNVQVPPDVRRNPDEAGLQATLAPFREELGLPPGPPAAPPAVAPAALVEAALAAGARVVSTALGDPGEIVELARPAGVPVLAAVTTLDEAQACVAAGVDAIVAQGAEAGGHRSTFAWPSSDPPPLVGTFALVPLVVDAVDLPVVATGGIMDGRGLAAALALGAQAAQVGTRFLLAEESAAPAHYREALLELRPEDTVVTDHVSGRPARWIRNRFVDAMVDGPEPLGWPYQYVANADLRAAARREPRPDLMPMLAGQAAGLARAVEPAADIVHRMVADAAAILGRS
jgi:nitronate monooxygenase